MKKEFVEKLDLFLHDIWSLRELAKYALGLLVEIQAGIIDVPGDFVVESLQRISDMNRVSRTWIREVRREITGTEDPNPLDRIAWKKDNPFGLMQVYLVREQSVPTESKAWYEPEEGCFECRFAVRGRYARSLTASAVQIDVVDSWLPSTIIVERPVDSCLPLLPKPRPAFLRPGSVMFQAVDKPAFEPAPGFFFDEIHRILYVTFRSEDDVIPYAVGSSTCFELNRHQQLVGIWFFDVAEAPPIDTQLQF